LPVANCHWLGQIFNENYLFFLAKLKERGTIVIAQPHGGVYCQMQGEIANELAERILADVYHTPSWEPLIKVFPNWRASRNLFLQLKSIMRRKLKKDKMLVLLGHIYIEDEPRSLQPFTGDILINKFYEYSKNNADVNQLTMHRDLKIPLKVFIQERLACIILSSNTFKVATPDQSLNAPLATYFNNDNYTRRRLITCDLLKERYCKTKNPDFLNMFYLLRNEIKLNDDFFFSKIAKNLINPSNNFKNFA
jgi:hypothetical protein